MFHGNLRPPYHVVQSPALHVISLAGFTQDVSPYLVLKLYRALGMSDSISPLLGLMNVPARTSYKRSDTTVASV
jgi:hypothetical protein